MAETNLPTSGLSDWQLKLSYWYITNKLLLRKLLVLFLVAFNCLFWGYSIYGLSIWLLDYGRLSQQTKVLMFSSAESLPAIEAVRPKKLNVSGVESFSGDEGRFDLLSYVENPNSDWLATFDYAFVRDDLPVNYFSGFALPGQRKILLDLGKDNSDGRIEIKNIKWKKITNFADFKINRDRFEVTGIEFRPAIKAGNPSRLIFAIENQSPYGFWEAGIAVLLRSGGNVVGVNFLAIPRFKSGEKREVELNWIRSLPSVDEAEVIPEINYLDQNNIMPTSEF